MLVVITCMKGTNSSMLTTRILNEPSLNERWYDQVRHGIELFDVRGWMAGNGNGNDDGVTEQYKTKKRPINKRK